MRRGRFPREGHFEWPGLSSHILQELARANKPGLARPAPRLMSIIATRPIGVATLREGAEARLQEITLARTGRRARQRTAIATPVAAITVITSGDGSGTAA